MRGSKRRRGPNAWQLRVYVGTDTDGQKQFLYETFHGGARAADARLGQMVAKASTVGTSGRVKARTFAEVAETWLALKEDRLADGTWRNYRAHLDRYVLPKWGKTQVSSIRVGEIDRWYLKLKKDGAGDSALRHIRAIMRGTLGRAVTDGLAPLNAAKEATTPRSRRRRKASAPSSGQVSDLLALADEEQSTYFLLVALTGLRRSEAAALKWDDIEGRQLHITRALTRDRVSRKLKTKDLKTHNTRRLVLSDRILAALDVWQAGREWEGPWVFSSTGDGAWPVIDPDTWTHRFERLAAQVEGMEDFSLHDLRHFNASELVASGADLTVIRDRLGWASNAMLDTYAHRLPEKDQEAADYLDGLLD
jgi:integrase